MQLPSGRSGETSQKKMRGSSRMPFLNDDGGAHHTTMIIIMRGCGVACIILADDVLILSKGKRLLNMFAKTLDDAHRYLQAMGAKVAPSESYNFASNQTATMWLNRTWLSNIGLNIEVVKDVRYLGAHLTPGSTANSPTINKRWGKAIQQLRKLKFCPATVEANAKAVLVKVYAVAFYGIDAAEIRTSRIAQFTAAVVDVFRSKTDAHKPSAKKKALVNSKRYLRSTSLKAGSNPTMVP